MLIEFYTDVGAGEETKKTAKMPLNKTCNNNPIVLLQNLGFACVMLGLPGISRPHWDFDKQGFFNFPGTSLFTSGLFTLDSAHEEVVDLQGRSLLQKHELWEA